MRPAELLADPSFTTKRDRPIGAMMPSRATDWRMIQASDDGGPTRDQLPMSLGSGRYDSVRGIVTILMAMAGLALLAAALLDWAGYTGFSISLLWR